jgi:hypothetical protein
MECPLASVTYGPAFEAPETAVDFFVVAFAAGFFTVLFAVGFAVAFFWMFFWVVVLAAIALTS